jgi:hypothetical protein
LLPIFLDLRKVASLDSAAVPAAIWLPWLNAALETGPERVVTGEVTVIEERMRSTPTRRVVAVIDGECSSCIS